MEGRRRSEQQRVPYMIQELEGDFVPWEFNDFDKNIVQGIRKDDLGLPLEYFFGEAEESDTVNDFGIGSRLKNLRRVSADNVTHLKFQTRLGQTRGTSILAPVLTRLQDLKAVEEAERIAAKMSASMAVQIIRGTPDMYTEPDDDDEFPEFSFQAGMVFDKLNPGEVVGAIDTIHRGRFGHQCINDIKDLRRQLLRGTAAASGGFPTLRRAVASIRPHPSNPYVGAVRTIGR